jgi:hypothetical protein
MEVLHAAVGNLTTAFHASAKCLPSLTAERQPVSNIHASLTAPMKEMTNIFADRTGMDALELTEQDTVSELRPS